jgi:O-antigen ligase/cytochrome c-type biogenesis protein CcmH/NrfG
VPVVFDTRTADIFNLTKLSLETALASVAVVATVLAVRADRRARRPMAVPRLALPVAALVAAVGISVVFSRNPLVSIVGAYQRYNGLLPLLVPIALAGALVAVVRRPRADIGWVVGGLLAADAVLAGYVLVQASGHDLFTFRDAFGNPDPYPAGTMGNSNFAGGLLGLSLPLWLVPFLRGGRWRVVAVAGAGLCAIAMWETKSRGGLVAALVGLAVLAWVERERLPRPLLVVAAASVVAAAIVAVAVVWHPFMDAPASFLDRFDVLRSESVDVRGDEWSVAVAIAADHPIAGAGPESFAGLYPAYRHPLEGRAAGSIVPDKPHSLLLETAAASGLLGVAALCWVVAATIATGAGTRRRGAVEPEERWLLSALVAAYAGYVAQALFSIDVPPLAMTGWLLVGSIAAVADPAVVTARSQPRAPKPARRPTASTVRVPEGVIVGTAVVVAALAVGASALPWRADRAEGAAQRAEAAGHGDAAAAQYQRAIDRNPFEAAYRLGAGALAERAAAQATTADDRVRFAQQAVGHYRDAERLRPGTAVVQIRLASALTMAASVLGPDAFAAASDAWDEAIERDPFNWEAFRGQGLALAAWGHVTAGAEQHLRDAVHAFEVSVYIRPDQADTWAELAAARLALGDRAGAIYAYESSLAYDPDNDDVVAALAALKRS